MKIFTDIQQGSLEWAKLRCGKITMSHAKELLTKGRGTTRESYILDVVSERLSGEPIESYYGLDMERGNFLESWALRAVEQALGLVTHTVGFVLADDQRIGCSPDALILDDAIIELKCPRPRQHIRAIRNGMGDYDKQIQGNLWVTKRDRFFAASFCPWVKDYPLFIEAGGRDERVIEELADSAQRAADEVDRLVSVIRGHTLKPGVSEISEQARAAWEQTLAEKSEVIL